MAVEPVALHYSPISSLSPSQSEYSSRFMANTPPSSVHTSDESIWLYQAPPGIPLTTHSSSESFIPEIPAISVPIQYSLTPETGPYLNFLPGPIVRPAYYSQLEPHFVSNRPFIIGNEDGGTILENYTSESASNDDIILQSSRVLEAEQEGVIDNVLFNPYKVPASQISQLSDSDLLGIPEAHPPSDSNLQPRYSENYATFRYNETMPASQMSSQELVPSITTIMDEINRMSEFRANLGVSPSITDTEILYFTSRLSSFPNSFVLESGIDTTQSTSPALRPTSLSTDAVSNNQAVDSSVLSSTNEPVSSSSQNPVAPLSIVKKRKSEISRKSQVSKSVSILKDLKAKVAEWNPSHQNATPTTDSYCKGKLDAPSPPEGVVEQQPSHQNASLTLESHCEEKIDAPPSPEKIPGQKPARQNAILTFEAYCKEQEEKLGGLLSPQHDDSSVSAVANVPRWWLSSASDSPPRCFESPLPLTVTSQKTSEATLSESNHSYSGTSREESGGSRFSTAAAENASITRHRANVQGRRDRRFERMIAATTYQSLNMNVNSGYSIQTQQNSHDGDGDVNEGRGSSEQEIRSIRSLERRQSGDTTLELPQDSFASGNPLRRMGRTEPLPAGPEDGKKPKFLRRLGAKASGFFRIRGKSDKRESRAEELPFGLVAKRKPRLFTRLFRRSVKVPPFLQRMSMRHTKSQGLAPEVNQNSDSQVQTVEPPLPTNAFATIAGFDGELGELGGSGGSTFLTRLGDWEAAARARASSSVPERMQL